MDLITRWADQWPDSSKTNSLDLFCPIHSGSALTLLLLLREGSVHKQLTRLWFADDKGVQPDRTRGTARLLPQEPEQQRQPKSPKRSRRQTQKSDDCQVRRGIEFLEPDFYASASYYEKWLGPRTRGVGVLHHIPKVAARLTVSLAPIFWKLCVISSLHCSYRISTVHQRFCVLKHGVSKVRWDRH